MLKSVNKNQENGNVNILLLLLIVIACGVIVYLNSTDNTQTAEVEYTNESVISIKNEKETNQNNIKNNSGNPNNVTFNTNGLYNEEIVSENGTYNNDYNKYFYNQLNADAKIMYSGIIQNIGALQDGSGTINFDLSGADKDQYFQSAWDAVSLDRPELFYVDTRKISLVTENKTSFLGKVTYNYSMQPQKGGTYFINTWQDSYQVKGAINDIESLANQIVNNASGSYYDKVKYIHDYIINSAEYNQSEDLNNANIYGTLINKRSVCEGYAKAFKYLLDKLDIPCVVVYGKATNDDGSAEFHAWNYVLMDDGNWYAVDTTWDDPIIIGNGKISDKTKHKYFLIGSSEFNATHHEDPDVSGTGQNFKYPAISSRNY